MVLGLKIDNCGHPRMPNMTIHMQPGVPACTGSTPFAFLTHPHLHNGGVGISTFYLNPVLVNACPTLTLLQTCAPTQSMRIGVPGHLMLHHVKVVLAADPRSGG
jgi:hypothetical protein